MHRISQEDYEAALRQLELEEGQVRLKRQRVDLVRQIVLLASTVCLTLAAIYCALRGIPWSIPLAGSGVAAGIGSAIEGRRGAFRLRGAATPRQPHA
jgi:hypothetical protein